MARFVKESRLRAVWGAGQSCVNRRGPEFLRMDEMPARGLRGELLCGARSQRGH